MQVIVDLALIVAIIYALVLFFGFLDKYFPIKRKKPDGYVGRFKRPDGSVVHVARVGGDLVVASEEPPGVFPKDLGNVSGRDLMKWKKLATTPDGRRND